METSKERIQSLIEKICYEEKQNIYYNIDEIKEYFNLSIDDFLDNSTCYEYDYFYKSMCYCYFITLNINDYEKITIHILDKEAQNGTNQ